MTNDTNDHLWLVGLGDELAAKVEAVAMARGTSSKALLQSVLTGYLDAAESVQVAPDPGAAAPRARLTDSELERLADDFAAADADFTKLLGPEPPPNELAGRQWVVHLSPTQMERAELLLTNGRLEQVVRAALGSALAAAG